MKTDKLQPKNLDQKQIKKWTMIFLGSVSVMDTFGYY